MAIRRAKQKQQVVEKLMSVAPPGEQFVACVHCETGPSPWLNGLFDEIPFLGLIIALTRKFYFVTLTNTSVVINSANRWTNRPGDVVCSYPRTAFPVSNVKRGKLWSVMYVGMPNKARPIRLNIHRYWRNEFDQLMAGVPVAGAPNGAPAQAPAPMQAQ